MDIYVSYVVNQASQLHNCKFSLLKLVPVSLCQKYSAILNWIYSQVMDVETS